MVCLVLVICERKRVVFAVMRFSTKLTDLISGLSLSEQLIYLDRRDISVMRCRPVCHGMKEVLRNILRIDIIAEKYTKSCESPK